MAAPVAVGKRFADTPLLGLAGAAVVAFLLAAAGSAGGTAEARAVLAVVGGACASGAVVRLVSIVRDRRWITPTDDGFVLTDRTGEHHFADETITGLGTWAEVVYSRGVAKSHRRTGSLIAAGAGREVTIPFRYDFPLNQPDPLGALLDRVYAKLVATAAAERLPGGGRLCGDGWALDRNQLTVADTGIAVRVPDIAAVDVIDGRVCVWTRGDAQPVVRIPAASPNAIVLRQVLAELIPPEDLASEPADGLGRVIFERDESIRGPRLVGWAALQIAAVVLGGWFVFSGLHDGAVVQILVGAVMLLSAAIGAVALRDTRLGVFRCHTRGVARVNRAGVTALGYDEIGSFTYSATRVYDDGSYAGTHLMLFFEPLDGLDRMPVGYQATVHSTDAELDRLREFITRVLAGHMLRRLQAGQPVRWTPNLVFRPEGLEVGGAGPFRGSDRAGNLVPYGQLAGHDITDGVFRLAAHGWTTWVAQEDYSQPNFLPGYELLMLLQSAPQTPPAGSAPAAGEGQAAPPA
jgi:hypothetical protein